MLDPGFADEEESLDRIDDACARFEAGFRRGETPEIERFLDEARIEDRSPLLRRLIICEVELNQSRGVAARIGDYEARFPHDDIKIIKSAFMHIYIQQVGREGRGARAGRIILKGYEILGECGRGGMGKVLKARSTLMRKLFAIKTPDVWDSQRRTTAEQFRREIEILCHLDHENVVPVHDAFFIDGRPFLVMVFISGVGLHELVMNHDPLPIHEACRITVQAAVALEYVHKKGIAHRDVKPSNLMIKKDGRVILTDFGLAGLAVVGFDDACSDNKVLPGGTTEFMSPERAQNLDSSDTRSDIYSLGATLYFLLSGRPPFEGELDREGMKRLLAGPQPIEHLREDVPYDLASVLRKMMDGRMAARYQTADQVVEVLSPFCNPVADELEDSDPIAVFRAPTNRPWLHDVVSWGVNGIAMMAVLGLVGFALYLRRPKPEKRIAPTPPVTANPDHPRDVTEAVRAMMAGEHRFRLSGPDETRYFDTGKDVVYHRAEALGKTLAIFLISEQPNRGVVFVGLQGNAEVHFPSVENRPIFHKITRSPQEEISNTAGTFIVRIYNTDRLKIAPQ